jgi:hypothetical protein
MDRQELWRLMLPMYREYKRMLARVAPLLMEAAGAAPGEPPPEHVTQGVGDAIRELNDFGSLWGPSVGWLAIRSFQSLNLATTRSREEDPPPPGFFAKVGRA